MRCVFIVAQYPISPNFRGGGSATFYERLSSLRDLGHEIHLWHYAYPAQRRIFDAFVEEDAETWRQVQAMCASVELSTLPVKAAFVDRLRARVGDWVSGTEVENPLLRTVALRQLNRLIESVDPDFIWAHHLGPARVATLQARPVVYSHHDWLYRVRALGKGTAESERLRRQEEEVARAATAVVSGSATESRQLRELGCPLVACIPIAYAPVAWASHQVSPLPRIVHLGGLGTTANRVGLERFFEVVWPGLRESASRDLWVIGDTEGASPSMMCHLEGVTCTGHVGDLSTVLRPFDLHIVPWEHDTGQRTRLPLIFNYGQVVVAVRAAVAGFPEVRDRENCRLVETLDQMGPVLEELIRDPAQRERLGRAARRTFETSFTRAVLLPRYAELLERLPRAARAATHWRAGHAPGRP